MPLVAIGVLILLAWLADFGPFGRLPWWAVALPFLFAVLWWAFADSSGWTQRRAMDRMDKRKQDRRDKAMEALGLNHRRERQVTRARQEAARRTTADPTQREHEASRDAPRPK